MESLKCRYLTLLLAMLTSVAAFADGFTLKGKVIDEEERALEARDGVVSGSRQGDDDQPERRIRARPAVG